MEANGWNMPPSKTTSAANPFAAILNAYAELELSGFTLYNEELIGHSLFVVLGEAMWSPRVPNDDRQIMYSLHDINGNGLPELFIGTNSVITGIYTLRNAEPESVIQLENHRHILNLFNDIDGRYIIKHGHGHLDHAWEYFYTLDEDETLTVRDRLFTNGLDWSGNPDRYNDGNEPAYFRSRLIDGEEVSITEEEYIALINKYGSWGYGLPDDTVEVRSVSLEWFAVHRDLNEVLRRDIVADELKPLSQWRESRWYPHHLLTARTASESMDIEYEMPFEYALYIAFLESSDWVWRMCQQCCGLSHFPNDGGAFEITAKRILDFNGDGTLDLWFRAENISSVTRWPSNRTNAITVFATIVDGEVMVLLRGYFTGGSIGGSYVTSAYAQETSEHLVVLSGFAGGFGGLMTGARFYHVHEGELAKLYSIEYWYYFETELEERFIVNGEEVSAEVYNQISSRLINPTNEYFFLQ